MGNTSGAPAPCTSIDTIPPSVLNDEPFIRGELDYLLKIMSRGESDLAELTRLFLNALMSEEITQEQHDSIVAMLDNELADCEKNRRMEFLDNVASGKISADAESRLAALVQCLGTDTSETPYPDGKGVYLGVLAEHIAEMRALAYQDFLKTDYWKTVRSVVVLRAKGKCQICNRPGAIHTHHRSYEHHGQEHLHLEDLIALCSVCHKTFHDNGRLVK